MPFERLWLKSLEFVKCCLLRPFWKVMVCMDHIKALISPTAKEPVSISLAQPFQNGFEHGILTNMTWVGIFQEC